MQTSDNENPHDIIHCVILAGGRARRFDGQDKGLIKVNKIRLIDHVVNHIQPQVSNILISANRNIDEYKKLGFAVLTDNNHNYDGPLAGILSALEYINDGLLAVVPCDMPIIPSDIIARLQQQLITTQADICSVSINDKLQPLLSIMHKHVHKSLNKFLSAGNHKVQDWLAQQNMATLNLDNQFSLFNINNINDLEEFERRSHE